MILQRFLSSGVKFAKPLNLNIIIRNGIIKDIKIFPELIGKNIHDIKPFPEVYSVNYSQILHQIQKDLNKNIPLL